MDLQLQGCNSCWNRTVSIVGNKSDTQVFFIIILSLLQQTFIIFAYSCLLSCSTQISCHGPNDYIYKKNNWLLKWQRRQTGLFALGCLSNRFLYCIYLAFVQIDLQQYSNIRHLVQAISQTKIQPTVKKENKCFRFSSCIFCQSVSFFLSNEVKCCYILWFCLLVQTHCLLYFWTVKTLDSFRRNWSQNHIGQVSNDHLATISHNIMDSIPRMTKKCVSLTSLAD